MGERTVLVTAVLEETINAHLMTSVLSTFMLLKINWVHKMIRKGLCTVVYLVFGDCTEDPLVDLFPQHLHPD